MNREDIVRMAREAMGNTSIKPNDKVTFYVSYNNGIDADGFCDSVETFIEHFANLVAAAERNRTWTQDHWTEYERSIAAAEREACAKVCDELVLEHPGRADLTAKQCAFNIRERGAQ